MPYRPLIHTIKGNLLVDTLKHVVEWKHTEDQVVFIESYFLADELVKQSSHVYLLTGPAPAKGEAAI